jgi:predicted HTH transcriptional regulator
MIDNRETQLFDIIKENPESSSKEIHEKLSNSISYATTKRILSKLVAEKLLIIKGQGKGTKYLISPYEQYFSTIRLRNKKRVGKIGNRFKLEIFTN